MKKRQKKEKNQLDSTSLIDIIYKYGNMYCIASVIYCINNRKVDDFTSFEYIDSKNNPFIIEKFINRFECFLGESKIDILDSNDFKKDTLYEKFKESKYIKYVMFGLKSCVVGLISSTLYTMFGNVFDFSNMRSFSSLIILIISLTLLYKKKHPITIIIVSGLLGIFIGSIC